MTDRGRGETTEGKEGGRKGGGKDRKRRRKRHTFQKTGATSANHSLLTLLSALKALLYSLCAFSSELKSSPP
jgi:hypothetical protein